MQYTTRTLACLATTLIALSPAPGTADPAATATMVRVLGPAHAAKVKLHLVKSNGSGDTYTYQAKDGKLGVIGTSNSALCRGVYDYLRANNLGTVGWAGPRLALPDRLPDAASTQGGSPFRIRHAYNVVTSGYTTPYWDWTRWEQELDWLALHGYNMAMAPVATEAIAIRVWKSMGLTDTEIAAAGEKDR